jgi:hypothetical protein
MTGMARDAHTRNDDGVEEEIARYRRAAEQTLDQLDWCVDYLYRIGKPQIARAIQKNRSTIGKQMRPGDA